MYAWKNRKWCIYRAYVMLMCSTLPFDKAIELSLKKKDFSTGEYLFCVNPDSIPDEMLQKFKDDVKAYQEHIKRMGVSNYAAYTASLPKTRSHA